MGTFLATITYEASIWLQRATVCPVRSALTGAQRSSLILLTKAYWSASTTALPVLAGVLPVDLHVKLAGEEVTNADTADCWRSEQGINYANLGSEKA